MENIRRSKGYERVLNNPWDLSVRRDFGGHLAKEGFPLGKVLLREAAAMAALPHGTVPSVIHSEYHYGIQFSMIDFEELASCPFYAPEDFAAAGRGAMCLVIPPISTKAIWGSQKKSFAKYQIEKYKDSHTRPASTWCLMGTGSRSLSKCDLPKLHEVVSSIVLHRLIDARWPMNRNTYLECMLGDQKMFVGYKAGECLYFNGANEIGVTDRILEYRKIPMTAS